MTTMFGVITSAALLDSINPCAISVLLLTIGVLISLGNTRSRVFKIGFFYIFALYITYLLIGIGMLQALSFFGIPNIIARIGAVVLALSALTTLAGYFIPNFPVKLKIPEKSHPLLARYIKKASYASVFVLGILVGLFEFPCTGGAYLSILSLLHDKATATVGLLYLLYYNLVFVLPLVIILIFGNSSFVVNKMDVWRKRYTKKVDIVSATLMLILAGIIFLSV
jgi:cytochrome c-type biogenesis protein